jgi:hypothetical protein
MVNSSAVMLKLSTSNSSYDLRYRIGMKYCRRKLKIWPKMNYGFAVVYSLCPKSTLPIKNRCNIPEVFRNMVYVAIWKCESTETGAIFALFTYQIEEPKCKSNQNSSLSLIHDVIIYFFAEIDIRHHSREMIRLMPFSFPRETLIANVLQDLHHN